MKLILVLFMLIATMSYSDVLENKETAMTDKRIQSKLMELGFCYEEYYVKKVTKHIANSKVNITDSELENIILETI